MLFGVPITPLVVVGGSFLLLGVWVNVLLLILLVPIIVVMRMIAAQDDQQFRLLGLQLYFRMRSLDRSFWKATCFSPISYKKRRALRR